MFLHFLEFYVMFLNIVILKSQPIMLNQCHEMKYLNILQNLDNILVRHIFFNNLGCGFRIAKPVNQNLPKKEETKIKKMALNKCRQGNKPKDLLILLKIRKWLKLLLVNFINFWCSLPDQLVGLLEEHKLEADMALKYGFADKHGTLAELRNSFFCGTQ